MIPSDQDYYSRRAEEHKRLACAAAGAEQRAMHERLVEAYHGLAMRPAAVRAQLSRIAAT